MAFFSTGSNSTANIDDLMKDDSLNIHEGMSLMEAAYAGIAETEMNWNAIMEAVALTEMQEMSTTGTGYSIVAEAGFFSSIVSFFKKIWEKIKGLFKKFMVMLGSMVGKDKDFAKKHGDTIRAAVKNIPSDAEIKGYTFTTDQLSTKINANGTAKLKTELQSLSAGGNWSDTFKKFDFNSDSFDAADANDKMRGDLCSGMEGASTSMTDSEMRDAAFATARNNQDSPDDIKVDASSVANALSQLEGGDKAKEKANKFYGEQEKEWRAALKAAEKFEKESYKGFKESATFFDEAVGPASPNGSHAGEYYSSVTRQYYKTEDEAKAAEHAMGSGSKLSGNDLKAITRALNLCKTKASCIQSLCTVYLQAVKDEYSQHRKICVKAVTYKSTKEGASVTHYTENAHFAGLNLI